MPLETTVKNTAHIRKLYPKFSVVRFLKIPFSCIILKPYLITTHFSCSIPLCQDASEAGSSTKLSWEQALHANFPPSAQLAHKGFKMQRL